MGKGSALFNTKYEGGSDKLGVRSEEWLASSDAPLLALVVKGRKVESRFRKPGDFILGRNREVAEKLELTNVRNGYWKNFVHPCEK